MAGISSPNLADRSRTRVIVHERMAHWIRQIRPRAAGWGVECVETRLPEEAARGARGFACPITLVDLGKSPRDGLAAVAEVAAEASHGVILVLDPLAHEGLERIAREWGATQVLSGPMVPPVVISLLEKWVQLAKLREVSDGWSMARENQVDPWEIELGFPLDLPLRYTE